MKKSLTIVLVGLLSTPGVAQDSHYKEGEVAGPTAPSASPVAPRDAANPSAPKTDHRDATTADKDAMSQEDKCGDVSSKNAPLLCARDRLGSARLACGALV